MGISEKIRLPTVEENNIDFPWITVEQLIPLVRLEHPGTLLRVAGRVTEANLWNCYCYGFLESDNGDRIKFRVSEHEQPDIDELVIIIGSLKTNRKLHLELHGRIEGPWIVPEKRILIPERPRPQLLLEDFIEQNGFYSLGFLISKTGWDDICTSSGISEIIDSPKIITNFSNEKQLIEDGKRLLSQNVQGIVIARGGGEGLAKIGNSRLVTRFFVTSSVRFYTAMGHANDSLIIEKNADEAFRTPSDFGHRLLKILKTKQQEQRIRSNLIQLEQHVKNDAITLKEQEIALKESQKKIVLLNFFSIVVMVICIFLIFAIIYN